MIWQLSLFIATTFAASGDNNNSSLTLFDKVANMARTNVQLGKQTRSNLYHDWLQQLMSDGSERWHVTCICREDVKQCNTKVGWWNWGKQKRRRVIGMLQQKEEKRRRCKKKSCFKDTVDFKETMHQMCTMYCIAQLLYSHSRSISIACQCVYTLYIYTVHYIDMTLINAFNQHYQR